MKFLKPVKVFAAAMALGVSAMSHGAVILSTDFDGRVVSGDTASNITWVANGVSDAGDLTAQFNFLQNGLASQQSLFDTTAAQSRFAVNHNLHEEGSWFVDVALNVLGGNSIALSMITLDAFIFNNGGNLQTSQRDLDLTVSLFDMNFSELFSESFDNVRVRR
ncbi:hypothetical protein [Alteromonas oceanisediminis]|uniref:hypothetical protein n=1 Tax=Alteromonas oceanisediminis TaxID=2836180 RepID=UPI001BDA240F|nr:hypothetical protein [Alteromonas oceanisediminis]MBT0587281.1 hypothetical protein [Alteromonas oceanisediminis]